MTEMDRLVSVYYGGRVVEPYVGGHVEFEDMSLKTILFPTHPTLDELRSRVKEVLGWTEDNVEIRFYGRYDVGQGHKYILNVIGQLEWEVYFDLVKESQFRSLEVFASKLVRTVENLDLNKSPSYHYVEKNFVTYYSRRGGGASKSELVREDLEGEGEKKRPLLGNDLWEAGPSKRHCGTDDVDAARVMKRELVQEGLDLSEHLSASVHWSSYGVNPEYPTEVAGQYMNPDDYFDVELSGGHDSVSVEVNRDDVDEEASVEQYDVEFAEDSDDDRPFPPLTNNDKLALEECRAFEKVFGRKPDIPEFRDLTHAHGALLDGGINLDQLPEPFQVDGLRKGLEFPSMVALKLWLQEYAIVHHRPYRVVNSAANRRYTVKCENPRCKWKVHATKRSSGTWRISRVGKEHSCATAEAIKQRNPSMVYHVDTHPDRVVNVDGVTKKIFMRAFWCFGPSIEAFKHCRPVLAIDATFLTGKYGGALMTALSADAEDQLVPLAFALVEKENSRDWCWFIDLVRRVVVGPHREIFERDVEALRQRIPEGPRKWLEDELLDKDKWSRAYDRNGRRWGYMTTNMAEQFNSVLVGVRKLPVTAIVSFTFMKCNDYSVNRHDEALKRVQLGQRWSTKVDSKMKVQKNMEKTVAYLFESTATAHAHRDVAYKHYVNEMDCLQPQHIEWLPYHTNEASSLTLNSMCNRDSDYFMYQCPLICFWAVEYHLPHRVMRQFGKKQDWPVEDISIGVELHKYDRVRTKKVKDWGLEHNRYIDEWRTAGRNDRYIETIHQNHLFSEYLRWLYRTYRLFLRPTWTEADIEDDRDSDEGRNPYDVRTRVGYQMEHVPLRDRVSRELLRSVNEMGHALQAPRGGEDTENTLRNVLEKVRQRCRKLAARLGCRSVGLDDVYQPGRLPPPLPQSARPSTARHSIRIEEREGVGGSSSSRIKQGRGKGKAPAPPSDDDDDEDEEDEDYVAPDAEEIDMSQLPDAPQGTQPTQYNLRSTRATKKREAEGGANHPGAAVGKGGASQCREAEGFRAGGWRRQLPWRRGP
uniref:Transposon protein, putative, Mutator sub-class n=1 Tax=Oryza sativa subsp. japonica TaxID=39947 RepID=Q75GX5_ORYSJ|nr:hypothetical protein [Oryza sativa Japonica Group]